MSFKTLIILAVVAAASANFVDFRRCRDGSNPPDTFFSTDCTAAGLCTIRRNSEFRGQATFRPLSAVSSATVKVAASFFGVNLPMEIPAGFDSLCDHLSGSSCPLSAGVSYSWAVVFPVEDTLPIVSGVVIESKCLKGALPLKTV